MSDSRSFHYVKSFGRDPNLGEIHVYDNGLWDEDQECPSLSITASLDGGPESTMAAIVEGDELYELHRVISEAIQRHERHKEAEQRCCDFGCEACDGGFFNDTVTLAPEVPRPKGPAGYTPCGEVRPDEWTEVTWFAKQHVSGGIATLLIDPYVRSSDV